MSFGGEAHTESHVHTTGRKWVDMTIAFSALFISLVSLGVAILHGRAMEKMADANARLVAANSWPFVSYGAGTDTSGGSPKVHMHVVNTGVGPAKIESAELLWKGVAYARDQDFLKACCGFDPASKTAFDSDLLPDERLTRGREDNIPWVQAVVQSSRLCCAATSYAQRRSATERLLLFYL